MSVRCDPATTSEVYAHGADAYDDAWSPVILPPAASVVRRLDLKSAGPGAIGVSVSRRARLLGQRKADKVNDNM
jgi:hypothetical protein